MPWESSHWSTDILYCLSNPSRKFILTNVMFIQNKHVYFSQVSAFSSAAEIQLSFGHFYLHTHFPFCSFYIFFLHLTSIISFQGTISTDLSHKNSRYELSVLLKLLSD